MTIFAIKINTNLYIPLCDHSVVVCNYICSGKLVHRMDIGMLKYSSDLCIPMDKLKKLQVLII